VEVAPEHAEAVRQRPGVGVEKGLLLDWIALRAAGVTPRHPKVAALVEADFAHTETAIRDLAVVPAGVAVYPVVGKRLVQLAITGSRR
jgi:hypothetical protein